MVAWQVEEVKEEPPVVLDFPDPGPFDKPIVRVVNASFGYPPRRGVHNDDDDDDEEEDDDEGSDVGGGGAAAAAAAPPPAPPVTALLANVDFQVTAASRIALLGRNGMLATYPS